jgi:hypothetical protein
MRIESLSLNYITYEEIAGRLYIFTIVLKPLMIDSSFAPK